MPGTGAVSRKSVAALRKSMERLNTKDSSPGALYTRAEAARELRVSPRELRRLIFLGRLTLVRVFSEERIFL